MFMYKELTDEELIKKIKQYNDKEAMNLLLFRYEEEIKKLVYFRLGKIQNYYYDVDEFMQLVRCSTINILNNFEEEKGKFKQYWICSANRIISTELKRISNKTHHIHISQMLVIQEGEPINVLEYFDFGSNLITRDYDSQEEINKVKSLCDEFLTKKEKRVLTLKIIGFSYEEIAEKIKSTPKKVDNIMIQIRKKLKKYL